MFCLIAVISSYVWAPLCAAIWMPKYVGSSHDAWDSDDESEFEKIDKLV